MGQPHKHADLIKQWADGAEIEFRIANGEWAECLADPIWTTDVYQYRIKPEEKKPVVRWLWADKNGLCTKNLCDEFEKGDSYTIKLEWSRTEFPE